MPELVRNRYSPLPPDRVPNLDSPSSSTDTIKPGATARVPRCECEKCSRHHRELPIAVVHSEYDNILPTEVKELTEHQYLLCPPRVFGFILKDRVYGRIVIQTISEDNTDHFIDLLDAASLSEPRIAENAIDTLVMKPEANRETLKAIVKTYTDSHDQEGRFNADFIQGKGEGQIILLHGPPGTGKTFTAGK